MSAHVFHHWSPCGCSDKGPCETHKAERAASRQRVSIEGELEMLSRYQNNLLNEKSSLFSPAERGSLEMWTKRLKELGVVPE